MSFQEAVNSFIPRREIIEPFMEGFNVPSYVSEGTNSNLDFALLVANSLKYDNLDFYPKLVCAVESYYSNGYDLNAYKVNIYRESMKLSPSAWDECVYLYGGMSNMVLSAALLKANILEGFWVGTGYMDFDYLRRRVAMMVAALKNNNGYYENTEIINFDILKAAGETVRFLHNSSALKTAKISTDYSDEIFRKYTSVSAGAVDFRDFNPEDLDAVVYFALNAYGRSGNFNVVDFLKQVKVWVDMLSPEVLWELILCRETENYEQYAGLSREYVKAMCI